MVLITFKTIQQETFKLELELTEKVLDVKQKIEKERGDAVDLQKLLYNGKVLDDESTVQDCSFDPDRFVVLMVTKKKAPPPAEPEPAATPAPAAAAAAEQPAASAPAAKPAADAGLTPEKEAAIEAVMGMGYTRDQASAALQAANWNADTAVDFLLGTGGEEEGTGGRRGGGPDLAPGVIEAASGRVGANEDAGLAAVRDLPQFDEIRSMVRANPELLPELLQQIAASNPELMQLISANQAEFAALLNEPDDVNRPGADPEADLRQRGVARIAVTPEENAAISRLKSMGFPEPLVIEAFFACDKNEDLAVNYILARMEEAAEAFNE